MEDPSICSYNSSSLRAAFLLLGGNMLTALIVIYLIGFVLAYGAAFREFDRDCSYIGAMLASFLIAILSWGGFGILYLYSKDKYGEFIGFKFF